jgi:pimeloyl-ACP methyl ester carboxylesterase
MESIVNGIPVHYVEQGSGAPVLALHGGYVDHHEIAGCLEPLFHDRPGYRRLYPDLPGMGRTPALDTVNGSDDILNVLLGLIDSIIGEEEFLVVGHSYGGYLARAIANRRPGQVAGLAVICPVISMGQSAVRQVPDHVVLHASGDLDGILDPDLESEFRSYLVVQTPETLRRFQDTVAPGVARADLPALERIFARWELHKTPEDAPAYSAPTLILMGRQDSTVGYTDQWRLIEHYPRATFAVLDRAGHALPHEQIDLFNALMAEWLDRVDEHRSERTLDMDRASHLQPPAS